MVDMTHCSTPRCRGRCDIIVLTKAYCWDCWHVKCEREQQDYSKKTKEISESEVQKDESKNI